VGYLWFFFFSSRRRHTRFDCDWSSDVCSSDLAGRGVTVTRAPAPLSVDQRTTVAQPFRAARAALGRPEGLRYRRLSILDCFSRRSEERRVGKECRSRWWQAHYKNIRKNMQHDT